MNRFIIVVFAAAIALAGCTDMKQMTGAGYVGDAITTAAITNASHLQEANPLVKGLGGDTALGNAVAATVLKFGASKVLQKTVFSDPQKYAPDEADKWANVVGMGATCWNLGMLAVVGEPISALLALGCAGLYHRHRELHPRYVEIADAPYWRVR